MKMKVGNMYDHVEVYFGSDFWSGFTPVDARSNLPADHGPWRYHATWKIYKDYPFDRIVPEHEIRAGIEKQGYYQCQLGDDQIKRLRGE